MTPVEPPEEGSIIEIESSDEPLTDSDPEVLDNSESDLNARGCPTLPSSDHFPDGSGTSDTRTSADGDDGPHANSTQSPTSSLSPIQMQCTITEPLPPVLFKCIHFLKTIFIVPHGSIDFFVEQCKGIPPPRFATAKTFYDHFIPTYDRVHRVYEHSPTTSAHLKEIIRWLPYIGLFFAVRSADLYRKFRGTGDADLVLPATRFRHIFGILWMYHRKLDGQKTMTWAAANANILEYSPVVSRNELAHTNRYIRLCENDDRNYDFQWVYNERGNNRLAGALRAFLAKLEVCATVDASRYPIRVVRMTLSPPDYWQVNFESVVFRTGFLGDIVRDIRATSVIMRYRFIERLSTLIANERQEHEQQMKRKFHMYLENHHRYVKGWYGAGGLNGELIRTCGVSIMHEYRNFCVAINAILEQQ